MNKKTIKVLIMASATISMGAAGILVPAAYAVPPSSSANTIINANIGSTISISTSGTVNLAITPTAGGSASSASDTVSVSTNSANGYGLQLSDLDTNTNLVNGANNISAWTGTFASPTALGTNSWGYRIDGVGTFGAGPTTAQTNQASLSGLWAGVPSSASPQTIKTTAVTASGDTTTVWYGAKADTTKPNGTYTDTVTYTATANS